MNSEKQVGLAPVINQFSRVLVLGSMPGRISLKKKEYYAHPRNDFWKIIFSLFGNEPPKGYQKKIEISLARGIGLWDVLKTCKRKGSLDTEIREGELNNFDEFFPSYPNLRAIVFNGKKAGNLFQKNQTYLPGNIKCFFLPSTSPAHTIRIEEKIKAWEKIKIFLE